ncbi:MAG: ribose 5-phosphate isomerase B [Candidatus Bipolaricaulia bacterium]
MHIALGTDHAGFELKEKIRERLPEAGHEVQDLGAYTLEPGDDYPDYAAAVAEAVRAGEVDRGIVVCGSGVGACVAANKVPGIRAALCSDTFTARQSVEDDDVNVLCLGARAVGPELAFEITWVWLEARFSGAERHRRRLGKVAALERRYTSGKKTA